MKFNMGSTTLATLSHRTQGAGDDLGVLIKQLIAAAQPLEGKFDGSGKAMFDHFKAHSDEVTAELDNALGAIFGGQRGMDRSFVAGETTMADETKSTMGAANFHAARFRGA